MIIIIFSTVKSTNNTWWQRCVRKMSQLQLKPPDPFDFKAPDDWPRWRRRYEQFHVASGLMDADEKQQVSTLLYCVGEEAESVLSSTGVTADERKQYAAVMGKFDEFFMVRRNIIFERARFNQRNQQDGETAEAYIMELYKLADNCNYGDRRDEMIRDRLVVGIRDASLSQNLQFDAELTLDKAKKRIRQQEAVGEQQRELNTTAAERADIENIHSLSRRRQRDTTRRDTPPRRTCIRCGGDLHPRERCPAKDATCHHCRKKGHYSAQCLTKRQVSEVTHEDETVLDTAFLGAVEPQSSAWFITLTLNGHDTHFKIDTGAEVTAISEEMYEQIQAPETSAPTKTLYGPSRQPLRTLGQFS